MLEQPKLHKASTELSKKERKSLKKIYRYELVKRSALFKIAAACRYPACWLPSSTSPSGA